MSSLRPDFARIVLRGASINVLGAAGKLLYPVFLLAITRIYGPPAVGVFLLMLSIVEIASCIVGEGFDAAMVTFGSRSAADDDRFYGVFGSALQLGIAFSAGASFLILASRPVLDELGWLTGALADALTVTALVLPLVTLTAVIVAATRARFTMKYDALINGFVRPAALIAVAVLFGVYSPDAWSLNLAYVTAQLLCAIVALAIVQREFAPRRLAAAVFRGRPIAALIPFGLASGVSSMLNSLATSAPVIVLGLRGVAPAAIAFFGTALAIASNMRQIRFVFSNAFAPVAAHLHAGGQRESLALTYASVTRWSLALTLPLAVFAGVFRREMMLFVHPSYAADATFILILLTIPILRCSPAGVVLTSSGYAEWALFNSVLSGSVTVAAAWAFVPAYGLTGAATAAAAGFAVITLAELVETRVFLQLPLDLFARHVEPALAAPTRETDRSSAYPGAPC
jgi:O-antigen/teichoic acid export membrane protein